MLGLHALELGVEGVVLGVGDLWRVLYVVAAVVVADLLAQTLDPAPHVNALGHAKIIRTGTRRPKSGLYPTNRPAEFPAVLVHEGEVLASGVKLPDHRHGVGI